MTNNWIVKALEIKTSMLFNLDFANNTVLSCFFFLIPAVVTPMFTAIAELVIPIGIPSKKQKQ